MALLFPNFKTPVSVEYKFREHKTLHHRLMFSMPYRYDYQESHVLQQLERFKEWEEILAWLDINIPRSDWHTSILSHPPRRSFFFRTKDQAFLFKMVWG